MTFQMLTNAVATGAGPVFKPLRRGAPAHTNQGVVEVNLGGGVGTINIEGRASSSANWISIAALTADGVQACQLMNEMRLNVAAFTSGTFNGWMNI